MSLRLRSDLLSPLRKRTDAKVHPLRRTWLACLLLLGSLGLFCSPHVLVALPFHLLEGTDVGPLSWKGGMVLAMVVVVFLLLLVRAGHWRRAGVLHTDVVVFALGVLDSAAFCLLLRTHAAWTAWVVALLAFFALVLSASSAGAYMSDKLELGES